MDHNSTGWQCVVASPSGQRSAPLCLTINYVCFKHVCLIEVAMIRDCVFQVPWTNFLSYSRTYFIYWHSVPSFMKCILAHILVILELSATLLNQFCLNLWCPDNLIKVKHRLLGHSTTYRYTQRKSSTKFKLKTHINLP